MQALTTYHENPRTVHTLFVVAQRPAHHEVNTRRRSGLDSRLLRRDGFYAAERRHVCICYSTASFKIRFIRRKSPSFARSLAHASVALSEAYLRGESQDSTGSPIHTFPTRRLETCACRIGAARKLHQDWMMPMWRWFDKVFRRR